MIEIGCGAGGEDEQRASVAKPCRRIEKHLGFRECGLRARDGVEQVDRAHGGLIGYGSGRSNRFPVRRPGRTCELRGLLGEQFFVRAIDIGDHDVAFAFIEFGAQKSEASSVGREADIAVNVMHDALGIAAEDRKTIEAIDEQLGALTAHKIDAVAIGRKFHGGIAIVGRRDNLGVALRWNIAKPEALLAGIELYAEDVVAVGRNCGMGGFAAVGDGNNRETFKTFRSLAREEGIRSVTRRGNENENDDGREGCAQFVLGCNLADS